MGNQKPLKPAALTKFYNGKKVLLTGHTGFKGAWLALWLSQMGAKVYGYSLTEDPVPSAYTALGIREIVQDETIENLTHFEAVRGAIDRAQPDVIFHLAAQPLVRRSYDQPLETIQSNILGTAHILEALRLAQQKHRCALVMITSDKCYENRGSVEGYCEDDAMGGRDIYSMTKGACELLIASYRESFFPTDSLERHGVAIASARAGNVIGGGDYSEDRIIPDCVRAFRQRNPIELRSPESVRPWQMVLDPLWGYLLLGVQLSGGSASAYCGGWNFGPDAESTRRVRELVELFGREYGLVSTSGRPYKIVQADMAKKEEVMLTLNIQKAKTSLQWIPRYSFETAISETSQWYRKFEAGAPGEKMHTGIMRDYSLGQIKKYLDVMHE